jgi:hypothetical protein
MNIPTVTVIPAQPGFFIAEPEGGPGPENEIVGIFLTAVIGWAVGVHREVKLGGQTLPP